MDFKKFWDQPPNTFLRILYRIFFTNFALGIKYLIPVLGGLMGILVILHIVFSKLYEGKYKVNFVFQQLALLGVSIFLPSIAIVGILLTVFRITLVTQLFFKEVKKKKSPKFNRIPLITAFSVSGIFLITGIILCVMNISIGIDALIGVAITSLILVYYRSSLQYPKFKILYHRELSKRKKIILGIAVSLVILSSSGIIYVKGLALHPAAPETNSSPDTTSLRIVTYNILYDIFPNVIDEEIPWEWEYRKDYLIDNIMEMDAEIFGFQECFPGQIEYFLAHLTNRNYRFCGYGNFGDNLNFWNNPIFYDADLYTYLDGDTFWHSNSPGTPHNDWIGQKRICTWARFEVKTTGAQFCVFNTHFGFSRTYQVQAAKLVNNKIVEYSGGLPAFLLGDFNLNMNSTAYPFLINQLPKPLTDAYAEFHSGTGLPESIGTFNGMRSDFNFSGNRIDMIFTTHNITIQNITVSQKPIFYTGNPNPYFPSDHFPVILDCIF